MLVATGLAALTGRRRTSVAVTALGFTMIKTIRPAAVAIAPVLGGVTRTDPTDLVALAALVPLLRWLLAPAVAPPRVRWLLPLQLLAVSLGVTATTATSCGTSAVGTVVARGDVFVAATEYGTYESIDGGRSWVPTDEPAPVERSKQACTADGTCFRLDGESVVEQRPGGSTAVAFRYAPEDVAAQERNADEFCDQDPHDGFRAIAAGEQFDGPAVVVAMGSQGSLARLPDGSWIAVAVGDAEPVSTDRFRLPGAWRAALAIPPLVVVAAVLLARVDRRRGGRQPVIVLLGVGAMLAMLGLLALMSIGPVGAAADLAFRRWAVIVGVVAAVFVLGLWAYARRARRPLPPPQPWQRVG